MDTSETRIKMCEKAEEIQLLREGTIGNSYYDRVDQRAYCLGCMRKGGTEEFVPLKVALEDMTRYIWLPHQGQLQELSGLPWRAFDMLCLEMASKGGSAEHIETKEQVGIMAVMNLLYNKVWDGEDWKELQ